MNAKGMHKILRHSKAKLQELSYRDDDYAVHYLQHFEVGGACMLVHYQSHLIATELFPEDADAFRFNSMTRKYCISLVNQPDSIALISSSGDINTTPHVNTRLVDNFKVACSPDDSFKILLK